jgi:MFS transporter, DHA3 family, macrolide efflux protein
MNETPAITGHEVEHRNFGLLAYPNFLLIWIGQSISTFGDKFTEIGIPILVYQITGSPFQLGLAFMTSVITSLFLGLVGGAASDRWDKRMIMVASDLSRGIIVACIPMVTIAPLSVSHKLIALYGMILISSSIRYFFTPAKVSLIPATVPPDKLIAANSIDQSSMKIMEFVGYAAAGLMIERLGVQTAFYIDAISFAISVLLLLQLSDQLTLKTPAGPKPSLVKSIGEGLAVIRATPVLMGAVALSFLAPIALGATAPLVLVFSDRILHTGVSGFATLEATQALGLAFGVVLLGRFATRISRGSLLIIGVYALGAFNFAAFAAPTFLSVIGMGNIKVVFPTVIVFYIFAAVANGAIFLALRVLVQENAPDGFIGRIFSIISVASNIAMSIGASTTFLADLYDVGWVLMGWAAFLVVVSAISLVPIIIKNSSNLPKPLNKLIL